MMGFPALEEGILGTIVPILVPSCFGYGVQIVV